jgi:hypothetical protein
VESKGSEYLDHVLDITGSLHIIGQGTGPGDRGTTVQLANGQNCPLVDGAPLMGNDGHNVKIRGVKFDGNKANQTTSTGDNADTVRVQGMGFGYIWEDVTVTNAKRWGVNMLRNACNFTGIELNFALCGDSTQGGAFRFNMGGNPSQFTWDGGQIDRCGIECIRVEQPDSNSGDGNLITIRDIKLENNGGGASLHARPIAFYPRPGGGGNAVHFTIDSIYANSPTTTAGTHPAVINEMAGAGMAARWNIRNVEGEDAFLKAFTSAKTSKSSHGRSIMQATFRGTEAFGVGASPAYEANGVCVWYGETATPEGRLVANPGSVCYLVNNTWYGKATGTGNTGWVLK